MLFELMAEYQFHDSEEERASPVMAVNDSSQFCNMMWWNDSVDRLTMIVA